MTASLVVQPQDTTAIRIEAARPADAAAIARLTREEGAGCCVPISPAWIRSRIHNWVVARDSQGRVVGSAGLQRHDRDTAELRSLVVSRRARGQGLGRRLVQRIALMATALRVELVCATTSPDFFGRLGFTPTALDRVGQRDSPDPARRVAMRVST